MLSGSTWRQIALAAAKWYMPPNTQLVGTCELRPLFREPDPSDEVEIEYRPTIAFPAALEPKPVLGVDPFVIKGLFFTPLIMRLNYVAQLSTTYLRANIDAKHCRLSHTLGTLCILSAFMEMITTKLKSAGSEYERCQPKPNEIVAAFTYAALHDAFQGPFGHVLNAIREDLVGGLHANRRLDKTLLNFIMGSALDYQERRLANPPAAVEALVNALRETVAEPTGTDLTWLLRWIHDASLAAPSYLEDGPALRRNELGWVYELLEGPIDADRWDYLWRDTLHLGFTRQNATLAELLRDFWGDVTVHWDGARSRLTVSEALARRLGRDFFFTRKNLYKNVYENPEKRIIDGILVRCLHRGFLSHIPHPEDWAVRDQGYYEFLINLVHITDSELLSILEQISDPILSHLARDLRTYPAVRVFWAEVLRDEEFISVIRFHGTKLQSFSYKGISPPAWADITSSTEGAGGSDEDHLDHALEQTYQRLMANSGAANLSSIGESYLPSLLLHCATLPKRPARVLQFERVVWALIKRSLRKSDIVQKIARSFRESLARFSSAPLGMTEDQVIKMLDACPPLFISFPWMPSLSETALKEVSREPTASKIAIRHEGRQGIYERHPSELMPRTDDSETYIAVAGYSLHATDGLNEVQRETMENAAKWAIRSLLEYGCCLALPREFVTDKYDLHLVDYIFEQTEQGRES